jgi:hypothetical protein
VVAHLPRILPPSLSTLLACGLPIPGATVVAITRACPGLRRVELARCEGLAPVEEVLLALGSLPALATLDITCTGLLHLPPGLTGCVGCSMHVLLGFLL